jgi:hypothetical protein
MAYTPAPVKPAPVKVGYKTTEFWLTLVAVVATAVAPYVTNLPTVAKVLALVSTVLGALGYTIARTTLKSDSL